MKLDDFLKQNLFRPLDIDDMNWIKDRSGNPYGNAGLEIKALDFAKLGQLMLNRGTWNGKRVISESWIQRSSGRWSRRRLTTPVGIALVAISQMEKVNGR